MSSFILSALLIGAIDLGFGTGRMWANVAAVFGLISVAVGGWVLVGMRNGLGSQRAILGMLSGVSAIFLSGLHLAYSAGGIGTGNGRLGAIVAQVLGFIGLALGGLAMARLLRTGNVK